MPCFCLVMEWHAMDSRRGALESVRWDDTGTGFQIGRRCAGEGRSGKKGIVFGGDEGVRHLATVQSVSSSYYRSNRRQIVRSRCR